MKVKRFFIVLFIIQFFISIMTHFQSFGSVHYFIIFEA